METSSVLALRVVAQHFFELASLFIAVAALVCAALAYRVAKEAIAAANASDQTALRQKVLEKLAVAERSYILLQTACSKNRGEWDEYHRRSYPTLGAFSTRRKDTEHIGRIEREGQQLLEAARERLANINEMKSAELEAALYFIDSVSIKIERFTLNLDKPVEFRKF